MLPGVGSGHPATTLTTLAAQVERVIAGAAAPRDRILGVGLISHGPQDRRRGTIRTTQPTAAWQDFPLTTALSALLDLPVLLENDAAAIREHWAVDAGTDTFGAFYLAAASVAV